MLRGSNIVSFPPISRESHRLTNQAYAGAFRISVQPATVTWGIDSHTVLCRFTDFKRIHQCWQQSVGGGSWYRFLICSGAAEAPALTRRDWRKIHPCPVQLRHLYLSVDVLFFNGRSKTACRVNLLFLFFWHKFHFKEACFRFILCFGRNGHSCWSNSTLFLFPRNLRWAHLMNGNKKLFFTPQI